MSPVNEDEFKNKSIPQIQDEFFRRSLASDGEYQFQKSGLNTVEGAIVLFQFANQILAEGRFTKMIPNTGNIGAKYRGTLCFDPESIRIFPTALTLPQIREFWPSVERFGNAKHILDTARYPDFQAKYIINPYTPEAADSELGPAAKISIITSRYVRDTRKSLAVKILHQKRCQVLNCPVPIALPDGSPYVEGHHLKPLGHRGPDDERNILCLCPYHHVAFDLGKMRIERQHLRKVEGHVVSEEFIRYHNTHIYRKSCLRL